jgi:hypothetical protein
MKRKTDRRWGLAKGDNPVVVVLPRCSILCTYKSVFFVPCCGLGRSKSLGAVQSTSRHTIVSG